MGYHYTRVVTNNWVKFKTVKLRNLSKLCAFDGVLCGGCSGTIQGMQTGCTFTNCAQDEGSFCWNCNNFAGVHRPLCCCFGCFIGAMGDCCVTGLWCTCLLGPCQHGMPDLSCPWTYQAHFQKKEQQCVDHHERVWVDDDYDGHWEDQTSTEILSERELEHEKGHVWLMNDGKKLVHASCCMYPQHGRAKTLPCLGLSFTPERFGATIDQPQGADEKTSLLRGPEEPAAEVSPGLIPNVETHN